MTAAINRSTPRVRWNFTRVDQSVKKTVKNLGMNGISRLKTFFVISLPAFRWEFLLLGPVQVIKGPGHNIPVYKLRLLHQGLKEAPPPNFKALLGTGWPPAGFHPADDITPTLKGFPPPLPPPRHHRPGYGGSRRYPEAGKL